MVIEVFSKKSSNKKVAVVVARLHSQRPDCLYRPDQLKRPELDTLTKL
jgi:hypothetical protein